MTRIFPSVSHSKIVFKKKHAFVYSMSVITICLDLLFHRCGLDDVSGILFILLILLIGHRLASVDFRTFLQLYIMRNGRITGELW